MTEEFSEKEPVQRPVLEISQIILVRYKLDHFDKELIRGRQFTNNE